LWLANTIRKKTNFQLTLPDAVDNQTWPAYGACFSRDGAAPLLFSGAPYVVTNDASAVRGAHGLSAAGGAHRGEIRFVTDSRSSTCRERTVSPTPQAGGGGPTITYKLARTSGA